MTTTLTEEEEQRRRDIEELIGTPPTTQSKKEPDAELKKLPDLPSTKDIKDRCKEAMPMVFETYYELMTDEEGPHTVRLAAANAIMDRGIGKAEQAAPQSVKIERPEANIAEVARMLAFAMRDAKEKGVLPDPVDEE